MDELAEIDQTGNHVYYCREWQRLPVKPHYQYMFIDECQDFNAAEISDFRQHGQYCWFFGDTHQSIMEFPDHTVQTVEDTAMQIGVHTQNLARNHRLTIENARVGEFIYPETRLSFACYKHGPKPLQLCMNNRDSQLDEIIRIRKEGGLTDMGILVFYNNQVEYIRDYFAKKGIPVEWKTRDAMEMDFKSTNPKVITFHCAKGLQFTDVFIPYSESFRDGCEKAALYVASTRPLNQLFLVYSNNLCSFLPPATSDIYANAQELMLLF